MDVHHDLAHNAIFRNLNVFLVGHVRNTVVDAEFILNPALRGKAGIVHRVLKILPPEGGNLQIREISLESFLPVLGGRGKYCRIYKSHKIRLLSQFPVTVQPPHVLNSYNFLTNGGAGGHVLYRYVPRLT